ncbi:MAG: hypothetical protein JXB18_09045 [Sedimentisphaerales bacterium]|nr:hypothetical protein [Sedimentisphaerales bacterium]
MKIQNSALFLSENHFVFFNAGFFSSPAVPVNEGKDMRYMAILLIWLAFLDIVIFGLNSDSAHGLTHIVVSWIIIMACIVIIIVMRKKGHKNADR